MQKETTPPDRVREALIQEAYEVLSDPERRDEYDASLRVRRSKQSGAALGIVLAAAAGAYYFTQREPPAPAPQGRSLPDILADASRTVGRVQRIDMTGRTVPAGIAFAIEEGVMATACQGLTPDAQLSIILAPRSIPARLTTSEEGPGICKLVADGVGSRPLAIAGDPKAGDKVYATNVSASGEVILTLGTVKRIFSEPMGKVVEVTMPVAPGSAGAPLLDAYGRVVAVATFSNPDVPGRLVTVPAAWLVEKRAPPPATSTDTAAAPPAQPNVAKDSPESPEAILKGRDELLTSPKAREDLAKKLRPPPKVPDDL